MIELKDIIKNYNMGTNVINALKGISLSFRKNEFVSILGPSGCGKTTLLNIIGGLDRYDSGDLLIKGQSTKTFKDKNWDTYRNHYVGFVFQSYNLIMHLTVVENVELALSIAGYNKKQKRKKAIEALKKVGLEDQLYKKPNQLSGGQMQRVAIARAIVNEPEIILADEPTGALDTETSLQIMQILKDISKEKLVILVTHNEKLAEDYSTRIIKMLDGKILSDSNPIKKAVVEKQTIQPKQSAMSFWTALKLSFRNLTTKKLRTLLTSFAGSIGIIGIALILALSTGFQNYINATERDTLSSYPLIIEQAPQDFVSLATILKDIETERQREEFPAEKEIYVKSVLEKIITSAPTTVHKNNLSSFKKYLEENIDKSKINSIQYVYDFNLNIYSADYSNKITQLKPLELSGNVSSLPLIKQLINSINIWQELFSNQEVLKQQYELLGENSRWPENYDEIVVILDKQNRLSDVALYSLGLESSEKIEQMLSYIYGLTDEKPEYQESYNFESLINKQFKVVLDADYYSKTNDGYLDIRLIKQTNPAEYASFMQNVLANSTTLKIVGIIRPSKNSVASPFDGAIGYRPELIQHLIEQTFTREIVIKQIENPQINVLTNQPFELGLTYEMVIKALSAVDINNPKKINIYPLTFEDKEYIIQVVKDYNSTVQDKADKIVYTDYVGLLMSSVTTILDAITYVLIAFVSISLVVSSIMIGIITYISVLERTNEIGILRSVGARKKDISRVFNAETLIVGFISGTIGILLAYLICIPVNIILKSLTELSITATLNILPAIILILISMSLTLIAGFFPSRIAANKDPVKALKYE